MGARVGHQSTARRGRRGSREAGAARPTSSLLPRPSSHRVWARVDAVVAANPRTMRQGTARAPSPPATARGGVRVVTVEPGGLHADGSAAHAGKTRILLVYGEHGRELITVEAALALLADLASPDRALAAADAPGRAGAPALADALRNTVFKIVPMENEGGRALVERGALCERKNGRGVDPNRNWGVDWGKKEPDYDPSEEYGGEAPFSEPEAASLRTLAASFVPHAWINAHSGMEALFMPYDHVAATPTGASANATLALLSVLNAAHCGGRCAVGSGGASVGYLAHGTATDYMADVLGVPVAMTWEVYGDPKATFEDCVRMFNPETAADVADVATRFADAVFHVVEALPGHPGVEKGVNAQIAMAEAAAATAAARGEPPLLPGSRAARKLGAVAANLGAGPPAWLAVAGVVGLAAAAGLAWRGVKRPPADAAKQQRRRVAATED